jgi:hypothetical protein
MDDDSYHDEVRIDSIVELTEVLMKDSTELIKRHGIDDPRMHIILASGFVTAIQKLGKVYPNLPYVIAKMLTEKMTKDAGLG